MRCSATACPGVVSFHRYLFRQFHRVGPGVLCGRSVPKCIPTLHSYACSIMLRHYQLTPSPVRVVHVPLSHGMHRGLLLSTLMNGGVSFIYTKVFSVVHSPYQPIADFW